ncbi:hypothetical protein [Kitasatospora sp. NPDC001683]
MDFDLAPSALAWAEADPTRHPFDRASASAVVAALRPTEDQTVLTWSHGEGQAWTDALTRALVERFGRWVIGWRWAHPGGWISSGAVSAPCCPRESLAVPEALDRVATALCEWRAWLEDLAESFDRYPLDSVPAGERPRLWERAAVQLVTLVVERTRADDAWHVHCEQVLTWFLTHCGVPASAAEVLVEEAIGGRFDSWTGPERQVLEDMAQRLAWSLRTADGV